MEIPTLGKQCSNKQCKQLDFVPLKCLCGEYYCKIHFTQHCLSGFCEYYKKLTNVPSFTDSSPLYRCTSDKCASSSYINMPCVKCNKHFCIEHRFHPECPEVDPEIYKLEKERWDKPREEFKIAKALVDAEVTSKLRKLQKSSTKSVTALKVQLMKLKSKAKGEKNIATNDRIYFAVIKPSSNEPKTLSYEYQEKDKDKVISSTLDHSVYVSNSWSLGRVIDSISSNLSIKNSNDKANEPKLRMFRESDRMCISVNKMDQKLSEIINKEILMNGETIILDYINLNDISLSDDQAVFLQISVH